jgi:poly(glycerol-phosphate) alpha-glucosyltransferase
MTVRSEHIGWSRPFARAVRAAIPTADVVHVHAIWNFPTWHAMREAHRARVPYVVAPQGSLEGWALGRSRYPKAVYAAMAEKPYFDRAASMHALTETEAEQCRAFGIRAPIAVLPNGVDLASIDRADEALDLHRELALPDEALVVLFLARLFPKKGLDLLIPAFARLLADVPWARLIIAGHDAGTGYRHVVERLLLEHNVTRESRLLGEVSGSRKFALMRAADVFALPSYSEGLPVAVLEAMACGCPVVVTPACNLPDVAVSDAGWTTETTVDAVRQGLRAACASRPERLRRGRNARALVERRYTWDRISRESVELYQACRIH